MARSVLISSYCRAIALMLVALFYGGEAYAGPVPAAFFGLKGLKVVVEELDKDVVAAGLTKERLETVAALRLLRAGIPVSDDASQQHGSPFLYVQVSALKVRGDPLLAYRVNVELVQTVILERLSPYGDLARVTAATGSETGLGYAGTEVFVSHVTGMVEEIIDSFALAYLKSKEIEKKTEAESIERKPISAEPVEGKPVGGKPISAEPVEGKPTKGKSARQ